MRLLFRFLLAFVVVGVASLIAIQLFDVQYGTVSYWTRHGWLLLIGLALLPRLTLLLSSIPTGGLLWWLGWLFTPRILIAILATVTYFKVNPTLVVISWLVALGGESTEKYYLRRRTARRRKSAEPPAQDGAAHAG